MRLSHVIKPITWLGNYARCENGSKTRVVCFEGDVAGTRPKPRKTEPFSTLGEEGLSCSETKHDRRMTPKQNLFVSVRNFRN